MTSKSMKEIAKSGAAALAALFVWLLSSPAPGQAAGEIVWTGERSIYYGGLQDAAHEFTRLTKIKVTAIPGGAGPLPPASSRARSTWAASVAPSRKRSSPSSASSTTPLESRVLPSSSPEQPGQVAHSTAGEGRPHRQDHELEGSRRKERPIKVVARPHCTDREGNWKQIVPDKKLLAKGRIDVKEDQDVLLAVKDNENSIGFIGLNMVNPRFAKAIAVDGIAPSRAVAHRRDVPVEAAELPHPGFEQLRRREEIRRLHSGRREKAPPQGPGLPRRGEGRPAKKTGKKK